MDKGMYIPKGWHRIYSKDSCSSIGYMLILYSGEIWYVDLVADKHHWEVKDGQD